MALSKTTQDHEEIRQWAESRGAKPAEVASTERSGQTGILRLEFPGATNANDSALKEISWDEFFEKFDASGLALVYQEETADGEKSNFNKLVHPENATPGAKATARKSSETTARKSSGTKAAAKKAPAKKAAAKTVPAKKSAKKLTAKAPLKQASSKKTAGKAVAKKSSAKTSLKASAKKSPAKTSVKASANRGTVKKTSAKSAAKKATRRSAPARKTAKRR